MSTSREDLVRAVSAARDQSKKLLTALEQQGHPETSRSSSLYLALVSIRNHGATSSVRTGWKHLLELEFDDDARVDWAGSGMAAAQADLIVHFCSWLGSSTEPIGLILRCDHGRRRSAAVSKALGAWCDLWVENPGLRYSRPAYQTMRRRIGTLTPPATAKFGGAGRQRVAMRVAH